jgi:hypothetical protein
VAYNYLDEKQLKDASEESMAYMKEFHKPLDEIKRVTDGKPGKVPKGKPRVTDGTLAGWKRETPKQVIQQIPTGHVVIKQLSDIEDQASGILTDIILPNANGGGTPYDKAILSIEDVIDSGSSWALCYFDRRGDLLHANYRLKPVKDILFEKGKTSEFDANILGFYEWLTESDIKARMYRYKNNEAAYKDRGCTYDMKAWQALLDAGPEEKPDENKTEEEKKQAAIVGYYKVIRWMQIGKDANFFTYDPRQDKVLTTEFNKDPRGVIPLHGLVGAPSRANPLGRPLAAISMGKQNLLDFRMQMEQYREGMSLSPPTKLWGSTPESKIKLVPDKIIKMNGTPATDDLQVVDLTTSANRNYANDSSYIRTQIYNEQGGSNDTSVSADSGSVGFSKTDTGVKQQQARTSVSKDHLRRLSEQWHGRIFETLLNIHFAESKGNKTLELEAGTLKRLKLEKDPVMNYDKDFGKIKFVVAAGTSEAEDNQAENEKLTALLDIKSKMQSIDDKDMLMYNQIVKNSGVDDPDKLLYTDEEIQQATEQRQEQTQMAHQALKLQMQQAMQPQQAPAQPQAPPQQPKTLGESVAWKPGDLKPTERAQALAQVGIQADMNDPTPTPNEVAQATDTATKIDKHAHDTSLAVGNAAHTQLQAQIANAQADRNQEFAETSAQRQADGKLEEANNG